MLRRVIAWDAAGMRYAVLRIHIQRHRSGTWHTTRSKQGLEAVQNEATSAVQAFLQQKDLQHIKCIHLLFQPNGTGILYRDDLEPVTDTKHVLNIVLVEQNLQTERLTWCKRGKMHVDHGIQATVPLASRYHAAEAQERLLQHPQAGSRQSDWSLHSRLFHRNPACWLCAVANSQSSNSLHKLTLKDFAEILAPAG